MLEAGNQDTTKIVTILFTGTTPNLTTDGSRTPYRSFIIDVTLDDGTMYTISHLRYSEFAELDANLKALFPIAHTALPPFPRKTFGRPTEEQWKERVKALDLYFTGVLAMPALSQNADFQKLFRRPEPLADKGMHAVVYNTWGSPDQVLKFVENLPKPAMPLKPHDVFVEVFASSVNATDIRLMEGASDILEYVGIVSFPFTPGVDICGIVRGVGSEVTEFSVGDAIIADTGITNCGGLAEYCTTADKNCAKKPKNLSFVEAAAFPRSGLVAFQTLLNDLKVDRTEKKNLLILGGHSGTGSIAIQIAKYFGCTVTCTVKSGSEEWVNRLGADTVYTNADMDWWDHFQGHDFDAVFDTIGEPDAFEHSKVVLSPQGSFATELPEYLRENSAQLSAWFMQGMVTAGRKIKSVASVGYHNAWANPNHTDLELLRQCIENGDFKTVANHYYPLKRSTEAFTLMKSGESVGKIVVSIREEGEMEKEFAELAEKNDNDNNEPPVASPQKPASVPTAIAVKDSPVEESEIPTMATKDLMEESDEEQNNQSNPFN